MMNRLKWLGIFENRKIGIPELSPAKILQHILDQKWQLDPGDKDMIVMQHQFDYELNGTHKKLFSTLTYIGQDTEHTAMSMTVGLPLAMVTKLILEKKIDQAGVLLPIMPEIYNPVLKELKQYGISFIEREVIL